MVEEGALGLSVDASGLRLQALGLWLDPTGPAPAAFVSHVHAAAAAAPGASRVLAGAETAALAAALGTPLRDVNALAWDGSVELPVDPAWGGGAARLSIAPAGHALGATQLVVEHRGGTLVYTGDWSAEADATHAAGTVVACDELVVATAFGLPMFRFEPAATVLAALVDWCAERLGEGVTPAVLAATPGPAQAIARALSARGLPVSGDEPVRRACAAYEELGVVLGPVREHEPGARGRVVVASAGSRATDLRLRGRVQVAYASAWALLDAAVEQKRADAAFALSDRAGHDELVGLVRASGARRVHATRGEARAFAHVLRSQGVDARSLELDAIDPRGAA